VSELYYSKVTDCFKDNWS